MITLNKINLPQFNANAKSFCPSSIPEFKALGQDTVSFKKTPDFKMQDLYNDFAQFGQDPAKIFNKLASLDDTKFQNFLDFVSSKINRSSSEAFADKLYARLNELKGFLSEQGLPKATMMSKTINEL